MEGLHQVETVVMLLVAVIVLTAIARRLLIPYPILLVLAGLTLSLLPGLPTIRPDPDVVFLVFLPPILWAAAYLGSLREFLRNLRPILLLAIGLVLITAGAVAAVAHAAIPGFGWAEALVLGAIVSPPDAVAATAIARQLSIPRRIIAILEGESLTNDAVALVLYRVALDAVTSNSFVPGTALAVFVLASAAGIAVGIATGIVTRWVLRLTDDPSSEVAMTLVAPYAAWVVATHASGSPVLACVAAGFFTQHDFRRAAPAATRLRSLGVWELLVFVLNGVIFILIGLQLGPLVRAVTDSELGPLVAQAALVCATVIIVRLIYVPVAAIVPRGLSASLRRRDPLPPWSHLFVVAWTGMRGIVSLAAALALPLAVESGEPFPFRTQIILITFAVILSTLVLQGLTLVPLIRVLHLGGGDSISQQLLIAREAAATAALERLDELAREGWPEPAHLERLRHAYAERLARIASLRSAGRDVIDAPDARALRRLRRAALAAERRAVFRLHDEGLIGDDVLREMEREIDVEELRVERDATGVTSS